MFVVCLSVLDVIRDNAKALQCDFLDLRTTEVNSEPDIKPGTKFPAGTLCALPQGSFNAVVMSLVLSYLPCSEKRAAMVAKARQFLQPIPGTALDRDKRGLLLLVETFSVDRKASTWQKQHFLQQWVATIESIGFKFLRHAYLQRSHGLAFVTVQCPSEGWSSQCLTGRTMRGEK